MAPKRRILWRYTSRRMAASLTSATQANACPWYARSPPWYARSPNRRKRRTLRYPDHLITIQKTKHLRRQPVGIEVAIT